MDSTRGSLLLRIRDRGDQSAWVQFDQIYRPMVLKFARARGLDSYTAEDVAQSVMLTVQSHINDFDYDPKCGRFRGWLKTIVNNRISNLVGKKDEANAISGDFKRADPHADAPDVLFDRIWMKEHLEHALNELRQSVEATSFAAFEAHVLKDEPVERVCQQFGLNSNQLYSIRFRLTRKLTQLMKDLLGEDADFELPA